MNKKWFKSTLILLFAMSLVLAGCGSSKSPSKASQDAMGKLTEMKSYGFETTIKFNDLKLPQSVLQSDPTAAMGVEYLKNSALSFSGKVQNEPLQLEMDVDVSLKGDLSMNFKLPMMMTSEKMFVKIPKLPIAQIPTELTDKFMEFDLKQLGELSGQPMPTATDMKVMNKFYNELYTQVVGKFDEKTFFSNVKVKDAKLPEDIKAKQVVKFTITNDNVDKAADTLVKNALPALFDLLSKEEYSKLFGDVDKSTIDQMKEELKAVKDSDIKDALTQMKEVLKINELSFTTAIDKDGYPVYTSFAINMDVTESGETTTIGAQIDSKFKDINKKQEFKPAPTDTITLEELQSGQF